MPTPPTNPFKQRLDAATDAVQKYWVWVPILGFLMAWAIYQFDPFYVFDQYKIASDESASKIADIAYKKQVLAYYIRLGNQLLSDGKIEDAAKAYKEAKKIAPFDLHAEYGLRKTTLLAFSEEKQFDPVVAKARFGEVESLAPEGVSTDNDAHIRYAKALLAWKTGRSPENTKEVKQQLEQIQPEAKQHSAALGLLGEIALVEGDLEAAIIRFDKALKISPYHWNYVNNLAYAYQLRADRYFRDRQLKKGFASLVEQAIPQYLQATHLDAEAIDPHIELKRLKALVQLPTVTQQGTPRLDLAVGNLIAEIESKQLHQMEKNKDELFYQWMDSSNKNRSAGIYTWKAKKAYLQQLQWLVDYFASAPPQLNPLKLKMDLKKIQTTSEDGKINLPEFLKNDLNTLKRYHPTWVATADISSRYELLLSILKPE